MGDICTETPKTIDGAMCALAMMWLETGAAVTDGTSVN